MNIIPPSRYKLIAISIAIVLGVLVLNKVCTGKYMLNIVEFVNWVKPNFKPIADNIK